MIKIIPNLALLWKHYKLLKQENIQQAELIKKLKDDNERLERMLVKSISTSVELRSIQTNPTSSTTTTSTTRVKPNQAKCINYYIKHIYA